eukprot:6261757-Pyramimonas_sp.AAC.1
MLGAWDPLGPFPALLDGLCGQRRTVLVGFSAVSGFRAFEHWENVSVAKYGGQAYADQRRLASIRVWESMTSRRFSVG